MGPAGGRATGLRGEGLHIQSKAETYVIIINLETNCSI